MDLTKIGAFFNPSPVTGTPPVKSGNAWGAGTTGGTGLNPYGNINPDPGLVARLDNIDAQQVRPTAFLGVTTDYYA